MCFAIDTGEQKMEIITMAYKSKGLGFKEETFDVFAVLSRLGMEGFVY